MGGVVGEGREEEGRGLRVGGVEVDLIVGLRGEERFPEVPFLFLLSSFFSSFSLSFFLVPVELVRLALRLSFGNSP